MTRCYFCEVGERHVFHNDGTLADGIHPDDIPPGHVAEETDTDAETT